MLLGSYLNHSRGKISSEDSVDDPVIRTQSIQDSTWTTCIESINKIAAKAILRETLTCMTGNIPNITTKIHTENQRSTRSTKGDVHLGRNSWKNAFLEQGAKLFNLIPPKDRPGNGDSRMSIKRKIKSFV